MTVTDEKVRANSEKSKGKSEHLFDKLKPSDGKADGKIESASKNKSEVKEAFNKLLSDPWKYVERYKILLPHILPTPDLETCLRYAGVITCSFAKRGLNVLAPMELGRIVNLLEDPTSSKLWKNILVFITLKFLNSGSGISVIEGILWRPIENKASERLNVASYQHVMYLSSDYHDNKKSAAVWEGVRMGRSVIGLISIFSFDLLPKILDVILAMSILWTQYDATTASIAITTMVAYNWISIHHQSKRRSRIRQQVDSRGKEANVLTETSTNWSTVAIFNRFDYEVERYKKSVQSSQQTQLDQRSTYLVWNAIQQAIMLLGLGAACFSIALQIQSGQRRATEFIVFTSYWSQLIGPMTSFVGVFMYVGRTLVEAEKLLEIFETQPSVQDAEDASNIEVTEGRIEFKNVNFGYKQERGILKNINFQCVPGQTTAIVGETGGGKSTTLKLIARLYDTTTGTITIDGQDIKKVKLSSLREHFGIVPQSIGVFNTTVLDNLRYAKLDATLEECQDACKAAALHERILSFPDGYDTIVGEKGVKISGGELQRLALARVVLKNPKILLLDEATSSIDTGTEAMIQESLKRVTQGRTTFVVAHRLSTIAHAELILVMKDGEIVEKGNHEVLLAKKGVYHSLWTRQDRPKSSNVKVLQRAKSCPSLKGE